MSFDDFDDFDDEESRLTRVERYLKFQDEQMERIRAARLLLRNKVRDFMEEETGVPYSLEDDLSAIIDTFTPEQQQNVYGKIMLYQQLSFQEGEE